MNDFYDTGLEITDIVRLLCKNDIANITNLRT